MAGTSPIYIFFGPGIGMLKQEFFYLYQLLAALPIPATGKLTQKKLIKAVTKSSTKAFMSNRVCHGVPNLNIKRMFYELERVLHGNFCFLWED